MTNNAVLHQVLSRISPRLSKLPQAEQYAIMDIVTSNINLPDSNPELIIQTANNAIERYEQVHRLEKIIQEEKIKEQQLFEEEAAWNLNDRDHLQQMEVKLVALKGEWFVTQMDSQKLLARLKNQRPLHSPVLMAMTTDHLHKLEVTERAELVLLEANTRRLQEIYEAEVDIVVDTGRKMGLKGERETILRQMEAIARGDNTSKIMDVNQARLISELEEQRNYIANQQNFLATKKKRVEQVLDVVENRNLTPATTQEIVQEVQKIAISEGITNPLTQTPIQKPTPTPDDKALEAIREEKLLLASAKLAEILEMDVPENSSLKDYAKAFEHLLETEGEDLPDFARERVVQAIATIENTQVKTLEKQGTTTPSFTQQVVSRRQQSLDGKDLQR